MSGLLRARDADASFSVNTAVSPSSMMQRWRRVPRLVGLLAIGSLLLGACGGDGERIRISAAASLQEVLPEILDAYAAAHDGAAFDVQYGGSQALATQIELGAEADLFLSANQQQVDRLTDAELVTATAVLASNQLVVAVSNDSVLTTFEDLTHPDVRIAIGAPAVPVGALTERLFAALDAATGDRLRANVITEDPNVRIALSRVELGEADAAFVYRTDVLAAEDLRAVELPIVIEPNMYVGAVIEDGDPAAVAVLEFMASAAVESLWRAAGFDTVAAR